jgi:DNA-directed RNA polymerase specialized sigma24 family protein
METGTPSPPLNRRAALEEDARMVRAMVATWGLTSADVDDITQEVLIALDTRRTAFQAPPGRTRAGAWRAFVWGDQGAAEGSERIASSTEDLTLAERPRALFRRAVAALPPPLGAVMELHLADLPMPAAAARLGIPYDTAWTRLRAAVEEVRATVRRWNAEGGGSRWR